MIPKNCTLCNFRTSMTLEPVISRETVTFHFEKHTQGYISKLKRIVDTETPEWLGDSLEKLVTSQEVNSRVYNLAAQIMNHESFFKGLRTPRDNNQPDGMVLQLIEKWFVDFDTFKTVFSGFGLHHFGSGWAFATLRCPGDCSHGVDGFELEIIDMHDAGNPMTLGNHVILTIDLWEHAYYIDYRSSRGKYLEEIWKCVNWDEVNDRILDYFAG